MGEKFIPSFDDINWEAERNKPEFQREFIIDLSDRISTKYFGIKPKASLSELTQADIAKALNRRNLTNELIALGGPEAIRVHCQQRGIRFPSPEEIKQMEREVYEILYFSGDATKIIQ